MRHIKYQIPASAVMVLLVGTAALAQSVSTLRDTSGEKCTLTIAQAPELRGLRLGMEQSIVLPRFANVATEPADEFGLSRMQIRFVAPDNSLLRRYEPLGRQKSKDIEVDPEGVKGEAAYLADHSKFSDFKGVRDLSFMFVDKRLAYLQVSYDGSVNWSGPDEFAEMIAKSFGLSGTWQKGFDSVSFETRILECDGFKVTASPNIVLFEDMVALQTVEKRRKEAVERRKQEAEEKKKTFKP